MGIVILIVIAVAVYYYKENDENREKIAGFLYPVTTVIAILLVLSVLSKL